MKPEETVYDLLIIGGGPGGMSAGIYAARAKLKTAILEKGAVGGQAATTRELVNYPGFYTEELATGPQIMKAMREHCQHFGVAFLRGEAVELDLEHEIKRVRTKKGADLFSKSIVLATGARPRMLNIPGEGTFRGDGVSYCATCDAEFYEGLDVVVVGNGDAAIEEAMYISKFAKKVTIFVIHKEGVLDCNKMSAEKAFRNPKLQFVWESVLTEICGDGCVSSVKYKNIASGAVKELKTDGVFIYVGSVPSTGFVKGLVDMDDAGYIKTDDQMQTSAPGVFAVGDIRQKSLRQVVTAASDGAVAATYAERYMEEMEDIRAILEPRQEPVLVYFWSPLLQESIDLRVTLENHPSVRDGRQKLFTVDFSRKSTIVRHFHVAQAPSLLRVMGGKAEHIELSGQEDGLEELLSDN